MNNHLRKFNIYLGIFFILIGLLINEKSLLVFSLDNQFYSSTIHRVRAFNISCVILGVILLINWQYVSTLLPKSKFGRTVLFSITVNLVFFIFLEMGARDVLFEHDSDNFFHKRLYSENRSRIMLLRCGFSKDTNDAYHPLRGWTLNPNLKNLIAEDGKRVNSNSKGIRGTAEYLYEKPHDKFRIVAIGDSLTYGSEVSDHETYPYYLNELLLQTEVINMGVHGYGHDQMLLYLQEEGVKYHPDIVLLGFVQNDMHRNTVAFSHFVKPRYILKNGQLYLTNTPIPTPTDWLKGEVYRLKLLDIFSSVIHRVKTFLIKEPSQAEITQALLDEMHKTVQNAGADFVMVYLPIPADLSVNHEALESGEEFFNDYCGKRQIRCLSLKSDFENLIMKGEALKKIGHWDAKRNYFIASRIRDYLLSREDITMKGINTK